MSAALPLENGQGHGFEGRMLGSFRLSREIACGGMATVYLAHRAGTHGIGQPAAVKVIHPHLSREREFVEMFLDEARLVSCIGHPNVCRVLDFGQAEGTYFLAMEFVLGETWADVLNRMKATPEARPMIPAILSQVLAQACEGLHAAHEARDPQGSLLRIVHRDISPQNIIVGYDGSVRVLDFGIASAAEKLHTTRNGTIKGRFAYMAPEQMRGHVVDRRADIWSLGVVLWEGLTQRRLFKRETEAETVLAVTHDPLPSPGEFGHPVPVALERITSQALDRDRDERFATAREMGLELSHFAGASPVPMGMPQVSMWMQRLFADQIEKKRAILREAANAAAAHSTQPSNPLPVLFAETRSDAERALSINTGVSRTGGLPSISAVREVRRTEKPTTGRAPPILGALLAISIAVALGLSGALETGTAPAALDDTTPAGNAAAVTTARPAQVADEETPGPEVEVTSLEPTVPESAEPAAARAGESAPATRTAHRRAESTARGTVSIATPGGWAEVYLGNKKLGTTPARYELPVGTHTLRIRPFGRPPEITRRVEVRAAGSAKLKIAIE